MSSFSVIRNVTDEDYARIAKTAKDFLKIYESHEFPNDDSFEGYSNKEIYRIAEGSTLGDVHKTRLWGNRFSRAVGHKWGRTIAYGCIGFTYGR